MVDEAQNVTDILLLCKGTERQTSVNAFINDIPLQYLSKIHSRPCCVVCHRYKQLYKIYITRPEIKKLLEIQNNVEY